MRTFFMLLSILTLVLMPHGAMAADALYRMLHADEVESFKADQDAVIVGQLINKNNNQFKVKVLKVISGSVKTDVISLLEFEYSFGEVNKKPQVQDFCVASIKKVGTYYQKAWGIFQASSGDYRTLEVLTSKAKADAAAIQWYVNSDGTEKDFFFEENSVFVRKPNGESIQIYPKQVETIAQASLVQEASEKIVSSDNKGVLIILPICLIIFVFFKRLKRSKK